MHASREDIYDETKSDTGGVVSGGIRVLHWRFLSCTNSTTGNLHVLLVAEIWKPFDLSLQNETCMLHNSDINMQLRCYVLPWSGGGADANSTFSAINVLGSNKTAGEEGTATTPVLQPNATSEVVQFVSVTCECIYDD
jgi:hypothetical protein